MAEAHLTLLAELLDLLDRYAREVERKELEHDREAWVKVKGALETAAQCAIDLALQIVARRGLGAPQAYREAFAALARAGVLSSELATELESWAGLRNVLTHIYTALDLDRIHGALAETAPLRSFHRIAAQELMPTEGTEDG